MQGKDHQGVLALPPDPVLEEIFSLLFVLAFTASARDFK